MERMWEDDLEPTARRRLGVEEDLSQTCRRDRYCTMYLQAFCSHCCHEHHSRTLCTVIPVAVDAAGQPTFHKRYPGSDGEPVNDVFINSIIAHDYATSLTRDAYCIKCMRAFCTGICYHHHLVCGRDFIVRRIEEREGRHYIRCKVDEKWLADVESMLGDPVVGDDYGELMLLPLLRRERGTCMQCNGPVPRRLWLRCSPDWATSHDLEVAQRRERRDARRAAHQLAKLDIDGSN